MSTIRTGYLHPILSSHNTVRHHGREETGRRNNPRRRRTPWNEIRHTGGDMVERAWSPTPLPDDAHSLPGLHDQWLRRIVAQWAANNGAMAKLFRISYWCRAWTVHCNPERRCRVRPSVLIIPCGPLWSPHWRRSRDLYGVRWCNRSISAGRH